MQVSMRRFAFVIFGCLFSAINLFSAGPSEAKEMIGWEVRSAAASGTANGAPLYEARTYSFYNRDQKLYLGYQDRAGANLGWDAARNNGFVIKRKQPNSGPLRCGEIFAISIEGAWVTYESQTTGINLTTHKRPVGYVDSDAWYQWTVSYCRSGQVIFADSPISITNTVARDAFVGCKRLWGVNLCWADTTVTVMNLNYHKDAWKGPIPRSVDTVAETGVTSPEAPPPPSEREQWLQDKVDELMFSNEGGPAMTEEAQQSPGTESAPKGP